MYKMSELRDYEVRELYWIVYTVHKRRGKNHREASIAAYEAVSLRYDITEKRIRNIKKVSNKITPELRINYRAQFYERIVSLQELIDLVLKNEFGHK